MKLKLFICLVSAGTGYIIGVLSALVQGYSLEVIFNRGVRLLLIFFMIGLIVAFIPEVFDKNNSKEIDKSQEDSEESPGKAERKINKNGVRDNNLQSEDENKSFSPMEPPILKSRNDQ